MVPTSSSLLIAVVVLAFVSSACSTYTILRTLLPLLPPHPLVRRTTGTAIGPYGPAPSLKEKGRKLKSAQRFTAYLAFTDLVACSFLVWEAALASSDSPPFGGSRAGAARLLVACAARPTILMIVAGLSYFNVVSGKSVRLGKRDWTVWSPPTLILSLGAGLSTLAPAESKSVWIGILAFLGFITLVITACFGRLLVAIVRVRRTTLLCAAQSPFTAAQEKVVPGQRDPLGRTFLPPLHTNFSALSNSFIGTIGRSTHSLDLPSSAALRDTTAFASDAAPALAYSPSARTSLDSSYAAERSEWIRSPTPNSTRALLASARTFGSSLVRADSPFARSFRAPSPLPEASSEGDHEIISFENLPRPSFGSYASSISQGIVGGAAMRQAVAAEVWGNSPMPGTGYSNEIELSTREARGAIVRIGGHLLSAVLGYSLIATFVILRVVSSRAPALVPCVLLAMGVAQPAVVLALQVALTEGIWFKPRQAPPVLTSSSALNLEQHILARQQTNHTVTLAGEEDEVEEISPSQADTPASSIYYIAPQSRAPSPMPGIPVSGGDCEETKKSALGRAWAMAAPHPKLLVLSQKGPDASHARAASTSALKSQLSHTRLRSLSLARVVQDGRRKRTGSTASRATVAGFEHEPHTILEMGPLARGGKNFSNEQLTRALLAEPRRASWTGDEKKSFSFGRKSTPPSPTDLLAQQVEQYATWAHSNRSTASTPTSVQEEGKPKDLTIDFLSSKVLPQLVPSVVVGARTKVDPADWALHRNLRRRSSLGAVVLSAQSTQASSSPQRKTKNIRNLSLPGFLPAGTLDSIRALSPSNEVDETRSRSPSPAHAPEQKERSALNDLTALVRNLNSAVAPIEESVSDGEEKATLLERRDTKWKDRTARAWDLIEARERALGLSGTSTQAGRRRSLASASRLDQSLSENEDAIEAEERSVSAGEAADPRAMRNRLSRAVASARAEQHIFAPVVPAETTIELEGAASWDGEVIHQAFLADDSFTKGDETENLAYILSAHAQELDPGEEPEFEQDEESGVVRCASIRPVSRRISRATHRSQGSLVLLRSSARQNSTNSSGSGASAERSITSVGYQNMLDSRGGSWVRSDRESSGDENSASFERRPRPGSALSNASSTTSSVPSPGMRPLRLLGQRDPNASASGGESDSDREYVKPSRPIRLVNKSQQGTGENATSARPLHAKRSSGFFFPVPPIPDTIEEADEDRKTSGTRTPTPKTTRSRASTAKKTTRKRESGNVSGMTGVGEGAGVVLRTSRRNSGGIPYLPSATTSSAHPHDASLEWPATSTPQASRRPPAPLGLGSDSEGDSSYVTERTRARERRAVASSASEDENRSPRIGPVLATTRAPRKAGAKSARREESDQEVAGRVMRGFR